jgi:hypothetical protein
MNNLDSIVAAAPCISQQCTTSLQRSWDLVHCATRSESSLVSAVQHEAMDSLWNEPSTQYNNVDKVVAAQRPLGGDRIVRLSVESSQGFGSARQNRVFGTNGKRTGFVVYVKSHRQLVQN